ncbi:MAG: hypothetical protein IMZ65_04130 [Planctomycetes bacterium]|nr:hypothetical protein [Planctomycetota bacterium]
MRSFVSASMIDSRLCSASRDGQELLPQLVAKLITASIPKEAIREFRFPHGDQVYLHGADGILAIDDTVQNMYVPSGISLWETGTSTDPKSKADGDFSKAEGKLASAFPNVTPFVTPDKATFVFVTSKPWESSGWVREKRGASPWKSVRVLDAVLLEQWIEQCPAVMLWFADVCGLPAEGLYDADQYLRKLGVGFGVPAISPEIAIAGREEELRRLRDLVVGGDAEVHVRGESTEEAAAFLAAAALKEADAYGKKPPLVFADCRANLNLLVTLGTELTLVPMDSEAVSRARLKGANKWRLIIPEAESFGPRHQDGNSLTLGRCKRAAIQQHLIEQMQIPEHKARQITRDAKGSLVALLWLVGSAPIDAPRWASRKDATTHASLILAGSWNGSNAHDTSIIERLSRKEYRDIETLLQSAEIPAGPWINRGAEWICASRDFVWAQLVGKVTVTMLADFRKIVGEVVGERDPSLELAPERRPMASILGKVRKHSGSLRAGLMDSVARLAIFKSDGQAWADSIVRELLDPERHEAFARWLSLTDVYSEIAEASPEVFLTCLDGMIAQEGAERFFRDAKGDDIIFGRTSAHVYLLWALERLAWQRAHFSRVLSSLAKLAEIDPGGGTMNRPKNSLVTILLPWSPQHAETMPNAALALRNLYTVSPKVTWDVAVGLLPTGHGVTSPTPTPNYREHPGEHRVTDEEYCEFVRAVLGMMTAWAQNDAKRWAALVGAYPEVQRRCPQGGQLIAVALAQVETDSMAEADKAVVHGALRELIMRHREYPDAEWALADAYLELLEKLQQRFRPKDTVLLHGHLFSYEPDMLDAPMRPYEAGWDEWIAEKQTQAIREVYGQNGLAGILRLAETAVLPECVGQAAARLPLAPAEEAQLLQAGLTRAPSNAANNPQISMARAYVWRQYSEGKERWLDDLLGRPGIDWTAEAYANLALGVPASPALWRRVEQWGEETDRLYWRNVEIRGRLREHWPHVLDKWKAVIRPWSALALVADLVDARCACGTFVKPSADVVALILEQALKADAGVEPQRSQSAMLTRQVENLFLFLDTQGVDVERLARLEWGWLPVLEHTKRGAIVLQTQVTSSPELFVELLKAVFRAEGEQENEVAPRDEPRIAEQAFRLLASIHTVPGCASGSAVNPTALREWVRKVRTLAQEAGRTRVCDSQIGQILSYSPASPDGSWPCVEVRDLIEEVKSPPLEIGLRIGKYNQRGAFFRAKGGEQEWGLAKRFHGLAEQVRSGWPRTAGILDGLAMGYEAEARQWDEQAKREEYE